MSRKTKTETLDSQVEALGPLTRGLVERYLREGHQAPAVSGKTGVDTPVVVRIREQMRKQGETLPVRRGAPRKGIEGERGTCSTCGKTAPEVQFWPSRPNQCCRCHWRQMAGLKYGPRALELIDAWDGTCAICGVFCDGPPGPSGRSKYNLDHDHTTGEPRGLLCSGCNFMLGYVRDSPAVLRRAAEYLEESRGVPPLSEAT